MFIVIKLLLIAIHLILPNFYVDQLLQMTPEQLQAYRWEKEIDERNRPLSDDELDQMFPPGYKPLPPPAGSTLFSTVFEQ